MFRFFMLAIVGLLLSSVLLQPNRADGLLPLTDVPINGSVKIATGILASGAV